MGMFDSVMVPCPKCGKLSEFQSKGGACILKEYTLGTAPADVLSDVNRHAPNTCEDCGTLFAVQVSLTAQAVAVPVLEDPNLEVRDVQEAFLRLCEALDIPATPTAYLEAQVLKEELERLRKLCEDPSQRPVS